MTCFIISTFCSVLFLLFLFFCTFKTFTFFRQIHRHKTYLEDQHNMPLGDGCRGYGTAAMVTNVTVTLQCFPGLRYCSKEYLGYGIIATIPVQWQTLPWLYVQYKISLGNIARPSFLCFCFQSSTMFTRNN